MEDSAHEKTHMQNERLFFFSKAKISVLCNISALYLEIILLLYYLPLSRLHFRYSLYIRAVFTFSASYLFVKIHFSGESDQTV